MDIVWLAEKSLVAHGGNNSVKVVPYDQWRRIKLTEPTMSLIQARQTVNITYNGNVFINIPTEWYEILH